MASYSNVEVPLLGRGAHPDPRRGGCLLEVVSIVPSGAWTDHPTTVDPTLASLARAVNDASTDAGRPALAPLIPLLATLPRVEPELTTDRLAQLARRVLALHTIPTARQSHLSTGRERPVGRELRRWVQYRRATKLIRAAVRAIGNTPATDATSTDARLREFLVTGLEEVRALAGLPPATVPNLTVEVCRTTVSIEVSLANDAVTETLYLHGRACLSAWPAWLVEPLQRERQPSWDALPPDRAESVSAY